jgi:hypothetical protein
MLVGPGSEAGTTKIKREGDRRWPARAALRPRSTLRDLVDTLLMTTRRDEAKSVALRHVTVFLSLT